MHCSLPSSIFLYYLLDRRMRMQLILMHMKRANTINSIEKLIGLNPNTYLCSRTVKERQLTFLVPLILF